MWSYEVLDAKLARRAKGEALLQLLLYSDLLALAQGIEPELMHLALGGDGSEGSASFRVAEYTAYYRAVRRRFEAHVASPPDTYPEPVEHCGVCGWKQACAGRRRADDHLSLVAGMALGALRLPVSPWTETTSPDYAVRSETRHEHLAELRHLYGFQSFSDGAAALNARGLRRLGAVGAGSVRIAGGSIEDNVLHASRGRKRRAGRSCAQRGITLCRKRTFATQGMRRVQI